MGNDTPLSADQTVLVDTNVFFAIGRPSNPRYRRFRRVVQAAGVVLKLPQRVVGELGGPEADRVETALDEGWAEIIEAPALSDGAAVAASDIAKRSIATETGQPEHEVEKADTILAGLAIQSLTDRATAIVVVLTDDKPAQNAIETAVSAQGYADAIEVYGVADIIGSDPGDSMRVL